MKKLKEKRSLNYGRWLYQTFLSMILLGSFTMQAYAAESVFEKAKTILKDVYTQIVGISTIAAVCTGSIALLLMNFSKNGRTVDESRTWLKRIAITWMIINGLGFIMAYIAPFFEGGTYTP